MFAWLKMNIPTILVLLVVVAIVGAIVAKMIRDKRAGKSSCSCGCSECPMSGTCHSNAQDK